MTSSGEEKKASSASHPISDATTTLVSPESTDRVDGRVGRFRLQRIIASGGMGVVYEAIQDQPHRTVALKVMRHGTSSAKALRRFEHEAEILGKLAHPNIAQVFDAGMHDDGTGEVPYFAMEYVPNARTLIDYARQKNLDARQRLELFRQVCDAVNYGHGKGVLHRDLKPDNILVDSSGRAKVIDFGVARSTDVDVRVSTLQTDVGQLIGTIQYMSPEQVDADPNDLDMRSDVYSLGVVLFELLCERLPYDVGGVPLHEAVRIVKEQPATKLSTVDRKLGGDLETIVSTAMHRDRRLRYQSVNELRRDVERYLSGETIVARRPTIGYLLRARTVRTIHKRPAVTFLLLAVAVALVVGAIGTYAIDKPMLLSQRYGTMLAARMPGPAPPPLNHLNDIAVVLLTKETFKWAKTYARENGLGDLDIPPTTNMRPMHGDFMKRLAMCEVGGVVWDIAFTHETNLDQPFIDGIRFYKMQTGADVVVAVPGVRPWPGPWPNAPTLISPSLEDHVRTGYSVAGFTSKDPWFIELMVNMPQESIVRSANSLAFEAVSAFRRLRGRDASIETGEPELWPSLIAQEDGTDLSSRIDWSSSGGDLEPLSFGMLYLDDPRGIKLAESTTFDSVRIDAYGKLVGVPQKGLMPGDELFQYFVVAPSDATIEEAKVAYEWIMTAPIETVKERLRGKIIVIGDGDGEDKFPSPDGRTVHGAYGHAAAIQKLLLEPRHTVWVLFPFMLIPFTIIGALLGTSFAGRFKSRLSMTILACVVIALLSILLFKLERQAVLPLIPILVLIVSSELSTYVQGIRTSHA